MKNLLLFLLIGCFHAVHSYFDTATRAGDFLSTCSELNSSDTQFTCSGTICSKDISLKLDVSSLQELSCENIEDCYPSNSNMICHRDRCTCPPFTAFNISTCRCEITELCVGNDDFPCHSHNLRQSL
ncbi:uncharacterized protein LOC111713784 [Eurytemora carolleeae]|uniref:uncharacterized protein LOC111713784 n=1 Tax=Eurytemora carolleeae TaxID=1294199 RepID=UPI000C764614|nr:uncharacterized protein LOC111713784 [Eurytemora carolleeae]|eukprot:XP_023344490.1 uncharacterized protein LOC111713784 [Eurytemora affinis]